MGTGKSSIGRRLAEKAHQSFYDCDQELEKRTGATINLIFDIEGEQGFRKREARLLEELTAFPNIILATGGGAVLSTANRQLLAQRGFVIYLNSSFEYLVRKLSKDNKRPLLQDSDLEVVLKEMLIERTPLYTAIADFIIDTDGLSINEIVMQIMSVIRQQ